MIRTLLLAILLCIGFSTINAQVIVQDKTASKNGGSSGDVRIGVLGGLNVSSFLSKDFFDISPKIGGYVGGLLEISISEKFYLQPETMVSFQGVDIGSGNLNLVYLNLPIMGKYHIVEEFAIEFGPQIGFVLGDNANQYFNNETLDILQTRLVQVAMNFGGGFRLDDFYFQTRFSFGLTETVEDATFRNRVFQIGIAYFF